MDKRAARCMIRHTRYNTTGSVITRHLNFSSMFARANDTLNSHEGVIGRRPLVAYCVQWKRTYILIRFISVCIILETVKDNGSPETSVTPNSFNNRRDPEPMIHLIIKKFEMRLDDASGEINAFHSLSFPVAYTSSMLEVWIDTSVCRACGSIFRNDLSPTERPFIVWDDEFPLVSHCSQQSAHRFLWHWNGSTQKIVIARHNADSLTAV